MRMKVLLLDTAFAAAPIYDALLAAGHEVWVMGNRTSDLLAQRAEDRWIQQDYSDVTAVEAHVRAGGFSRVIPGCTDVSIATCASLSVMQGHMDDSDTNTAISDKARFREISARIGMRAPRVVTPDTLPSAGRLICKPVDAFSGRGISIFDVSEPGALERSLDIARAASPSGRSVIETFVEGQLHSCTGFLEGGRLVDTFYVIEGSSANPFAVDTSYVTDDVPLAFRVELEKSLEDLATELNLADGLIHTQFLLAQDGAYVVEVSRRCPGDLYSLLIEFTTGYPYAARYASFFVGDQVAASAGSRRHILRHTVTSDADSVYGGLKLDRSLPVHSFFPLQSVGQRLLARQGNRAGILFCEAPTPPDLLSMYDKFLNRQAYRVT
jgi:hypothetical protein